MHHMSVSIIKKCMNSVPRKLSLRAQSKYPVVEHWAPSYTHIAEKKRT